MTVQLDARTNNALRVAETARIALAAEVASLRLEVRRLRALKLHPELEPIIDLVRGDTDEEFADNAASLAAALAAARRHPPRRAQH